MRHIHASALGAGCLVLVLLFIFPSHPGSSQATPVSIYKEDCYGFELRNVKVDHQGKNVLRINVLYRYAPTLKPADYMDVNKLRDGVLQAIRRYPNRTDYWEIYTAKIADSVYTRYAGQLEALRVKLEIAPGPGEPFARTSLVVRSRAGSAPLIP